MSNSSQDEGMLPIPGLGDNKHRPRERGSCFGYIPDAFSGRSPSLPSESDSGKSRSASVAGASSMSGDSLAWAAVREGSLLVAPHCILVGGHIALTTSYKD